LQGHFREPPRVLPRLRHGDFPFQPQLPWFQRFPPPANLPGISWALQVRGAVRAEPEQTPAGPPPEEPLSGAIRPSWSPRGGGPRASRCSNPCEAAGPIRPSPPAARSGGCRRRRARRRHDRWTVTALDGDGGSEVSCQASIR
jgi:hypothetical protein